MIAVFGLLSAAALNAGQSPIRIEDPVADPDAVVLVGNARFTVLTDRLVRMEWAEDGVFEDRATLGIINRRLPVPEHKVVRRKSGVSIKTSALTLTYRNTGKFSPDNLSVSFKMEVKGEKNPRTVVWTPGTDDSGNLLGTARTLDHCAKKEDTYTVQKMDKGVVSRDGWAIVDESDRHILTDESDDWAHWVEPRPAGDRQDLYIFAYGHDYLGAIGDFTKIAGRVPLPPKYAFGFWQSRYWSYSDYEFIDMARRMRREDIPADVMIIDMDWHKTFDLGEGRRVMDEFNQRIGWTGYTWNDNLFPDPEATLAELHDLNFKTSLNLHPGSGIQPYEDVYETFRKDYLSRAKTYDGPEGYVYGEGGWLFKGNKEKFGKAGENAPVPFRISQKEWTESYFTTVLHPLEKQGVDFWWLDWASWRECKYMPGLSATFWLNYTFFQDKVRQSSSLGKYAPRPVIYHRWGGLGNHRYQLGFSGDTYVRWSVLAFEPWFTATASNVCYGYWGHDLGGHYGAEGNIGKDPELYTRWMQYGVFSPLFKVHSSKNSSIERRIWNYPTHSRYLKDAIRLRYTLSTYIYDAARQCYDTGICLCRPLYYYAPDDERSYSYDEEYFFGDNILSTVICQPADPQTGLSERTMFFPEGNDWYDMATGNIYKGGTETVLHYSINENPWFVKAGAIVPLASPELSNLQEKSNVLRILVAPGEGDSEYVTYEDDGTTQAFETEYATTLIRKSSDGKSTVVVVGPRKGSYRGIETTRKVSIILEGVFAPKSVKACGVEIPYSRFPQKEKGASWTYDGASLAAVVCFPESSASEEISVECLFDPDEDRSLLEGKKGLMGRMMSATDEIKTAWPNANFEYLKLAGCASHITADPGKTAEILRSIDTAAVDASWDLNPDFPAALASKLRAYTNIK